MDKPIRIAMIMGKMVGGGVEAVVMNYYRNINREIIQFDFIIDEDSTIVPEKEILDLGGKIFRIPPYQKINEYMMSLSKIFSSQDYKIVHSHINTISFIPLRVAKKCNVPIRIAHNHSTSAPEEVKKNIIKKILKLFSTIYPTHYMSPTIETGKWLFGKSISEEELFIVNNAIDLNKFSFDSIVRQKLRYKLGYTEEDIIIGNIGRMVWQKNQKFVIEVFEDLVKKNANFKLMIVGEGPLNTELQKLIDQLGLKQSVKLISNIDNIEEYYQLMDVFLFPSNYEGLGMVAVEAQKSGLPVVVSNRVPQEACISKELFHSVDLHESVDIWAGKILEILESHRSSRKKEIISMEYDIKIQAEKLENYYLNLLK